MAQLVLTAASAAAPALGKVVSGTVAAYAAGFADRLLFGPRKRKTVGPRLEALRLQASTEGAPMLRAFGRARLSGEIIWAANFRETAEETTQTSGKGGRLAASRTTTTEYLYSISFAVGLCEGPIDRIGRVWADGKPLDLSRLNARVHFGGEDQLPDSMIEAVEGAGAAPAFRGLAYVVFEDLPLRDFGNRIPQLSFEVERSLRDADPDSLENALTAITLIPGSGEFALGTAKVLREAGEGVYIPENVHNSAGVADIVDSLDALKAACPNVSAASLVVSWFGDDLRAGHCKLRPGVEVAEKSTAPYSWSVGGAGRSGARIISTIDGGPAYGGTPSDRSVREAIAELKARGLSVMFHPFILMDVPPGAGLPDPYGGLEQAAFPWRGRITVGAQDKTAAAAGDIAAFFGSAAASDFSVENGEVVYSGPDEWSFRRMILHYATLCASTGGVDRFLIGSELRGLTTARSGASSFPAVAALRALAADVKTILPGAEISYGADWSEYFGFQPADGSGDVFFHLDPFWADPNVAFVGIDNYLPLADWRDGFSHADAGQAGPHARDYLRANVEGGEYYDWHYGSDADRASQTRAPITDGAYSEPWVFRPKDLRRWWSHPHHDRPGGARAFAPTAWVPQSKPIVFTEAGCAAIDKGANAPNLFLDPKSAENAIPPYSTGARDDLAQRRFIEALLSYWRAPGANPVSPVYAGPMIDIDRTYAYAWDARPFPFFPARGDVWSDAGNWSRGHWLNGRVGRAPLDLLVAALAASAGAVDTSRLEGVVSGYVLDRPMSPREAIDPLADIFRFDMIETAERLRFQSRAGAPVLAVAAADLVEAGDGAAFSASLAQGAELPSAVRIGFVDETADYAPAAAEARDPASAGGPEAGLAVPVVMDDAEAVLRARALFADARLMRETARFSLPPAMLAVEPGDVVEVEEEGATRAWRVTEIIDGPVRRIEATRAAALSLNAPAEQTRFRPTAPARAPGPPVFALIDAPPLAGWESGATEAAALFAAFADPWPGEVALYRDGLSGPVLSATAARAAVMGRLAAPLAPGASGRWTQTSLRVRLSFGAFAARSDAETLAGANALLVETDEGWEGLQFAGAVLEEDGVWTLSRLLRGQAGTEDMAARGAETGARCVLLGPALARASCPLDLRGLPLVWRAGALGEHPDSSSFAARSVVLGARALRPLSPVHLKARKESGGVRVSWIRRSRIGGEGWQIDVPLGETRERYRLRVLRDGETVREVETDHTDYLYTNEDVLTDFGPDGFGTHGGAAIEIAQISEVVGPGTAAKIVISG